MTNQIALPEFEAAVSAEMRRLYGITWEDACGDDDTLVLALANGRSPAEFVYWFGERYDFEPVNSLW
jgi:hypothetical protein